MWSRFSRLNASDVTIVMGILRGTMVRSSTKGVPPMVATISDACCVIPTLSSLVRP